LRVDLGGNPTLRDMVARMRKVVLEGFAHEGLPFEHLLQALKVQRDSSQIPLVPVVVRHQNFPMSPLSQWSDGVRLEKFELGGDRTTPNEMDWQFYGDGSTLELTLEYAADLFAHDTVMRMVQHHQQRSEERRVGK